MSASALDAPISERRHVAGWWARFGASLLDGIIQGVALAILYVFATALDNTAAWVVAVVGIAAMYLLYAPMMLAYHQGQTWGKQAVGARVVNQDGSPIGLGRACVREIGLKVLPSIVSPLNLVDYLWAAFREDRRTLHDLGAGTVVLDD
jgi:uncharacterized RDD family membrane protein YckC